MKFIIIVRLLIISLAAAFLAACQTTAALKEGDQLHISNVVVSKVNKKVGTVNLVEDVRVKTLRQARRYPKVGRAATLKVEITDMHAKNPALSLLVGDTDRLVAVVHLTDNTTGEQIASFNAVASDKVYLNGVAGALQAGMSNPIDTERQLASSLAAKMMLQIYGPERSRDIKALETIQTVSANYPANYEKLQQDRKCQYFRNQKANAENGATRGGHVDVPDHCRV